MEVTLPITAILTVAGTLAGAYGNSLMNAKRDITQIIKIEDSTLKNATEIDKLRSFYDEMIRIIYKLQTNSEHMATDVAEIKELIKERNNNCIRCKEEINTSLRRCYAKIEAHLLNEHGIHNI